MVLPSGIYTIQNVRYRNWAMLFDANEGDVVAGSSHRANVGEKVRQDLGNVNSTAKFNESF
jgi:hypothetical protein